jgi:hypothetical protein
MTSAFKRVGLAALSLASLLGGLTWAAHPGERGGEFFSTAHAVIGRPVTPVSYAGVARRTTVRTVSYGTAYGATAYGATAYGARAAGAVVVATPGVGVAGVGAGARGVGVTAAPGVNTPANRGGPVNRAGRR